VTPAIRKIMSAEVRAYCQEELRAATKITVKASRLSVNRLAQFIAYLKLFHLGDSSARMSRGLELWVFPDRNFSLQFIHDPFTGGKSFRAMRSRHPQPKGRLPCRDKANAMMNDHAFERKLLGCRAPNPAQLVPSHRPVRLIINSIDFAPVFDSSNQAVKIDDRPRREIQSVGWRL
jgi:hypothetical protein